MTALLRDELCAQGDVVDVRVYDGQGHDATVTASSHDVRHWVNDRFHAIPAANTC